jgi:hypothetical protein
MNRMPAIGSSSGGLIFTTSHGGFIDPRNASRMFHDLCGKAITPSCGHTIFGTRAPRSSSRWGVQPATVQRIRRHNSITVTTGTYVEVIEAVQRDALDSMGSLFGAEPGAGGSH